jgi:hypothetical protein
LRRSWRKSKPTHCRREVVTRAEREGMGQSGFAGAASIIEMPPAGGDGGAHASLGSALRLIAL